MTRILRGVKYVKLIIQRSGYCKIITLIKNNSFENVKNHRIIKLITFSIILAQQGLLPLMC